MSRRDTYIASRRQSLDLVPAKAYSREPTAIEAKMDFVTLEAEEGYAMTRARVVLGVLLAAQSEEVLKWARAAVRGSRAKLSEVNPPLAREFEDEFKRVALRAYAEGAFAADAADRRFSVGIGGPTPKQTDTTLTEFGVRSIERRAERAGLAFARLPIRRVAHVMDSAFDVTGNQIVSLEEIERRIKSVYGSFLEPLETGPVPIELADPAVEIVPRKPKKRKRRGRSMRVRDRAQYEAWQRQFLPYSKRIKLPLEEYVRRGRVPQLNARNARVVLVTERTRYVNAGIIDRAARNPEVVAFQYSALRDGHEVCPICEERDQIIRKKADPFWHSSTPPVHFSCYCFLVPIMRAEKMRVTPKRDLPDAYDIAEGFGGYNPNRVLTQRRLGIRLAEAA